MSKIKRKEMIDSINDHERRINRFERLLKQNGFGFDLPELPKAGDFFEITQHHSQKLPKGKVLEIAKVNHNTNQIKFVGGFNGYFTDFDRSVYLGGAEDEPMKPCTKPEQAEPQTKQLDQSVFDGLDEEYRFAAICLSGKAVATKCEPEVMINGYYCEDGYLLVGTDYDTSNWQNSLIERESKELTGSDLCRKMLERGDKYVMCALDDYSDREAIHDTHISVVLTVDGGYFCEQDGTIWTYAVPINNQGEPLTAADVGL